jgi:toxin ParE1/3/4
MLVYVAVDNVEAALSLNERFEQTFTVLARNPRAGRERSDLGVDVRSFPMGPYVILYRLVPGEILIARIRHGAMDMTQQLEGLN